MFLNRPITRVSLNLHQIVKYSINLSDHSQGFEFKNNFTNEEKVKILNILNESNRDELSRFRVSQSRIKSLEIWRNKKGPFKSLNDVLEVDGLGQKVLAKICEQIILTNEVTENAEAPVVKPKERRIKQLLYPPLLVSPREINSAVGIYLGSTGISWAKLSQQENTLQNWSYDNFTSLPKKLLPNDNFELAMKILPNIPPADVYVFESPNNIAPQSQSQTAVTSYNQQLELSAMLLALINTSRVHNLSQHIEDKSNQQIFLNKVYQLRSKIPARIFRTLLGNEKVSAVTTISDLVNGSTLSLPCSAVSVDQQIKDNYNSQIPANKELLAQALMLVVSFMDLCVYKNPHSIAALAPGRK